MERTTFLERVRAAVAGAPAADLPKRFPRTPASGERATFEAFAAALAAANGLARLTMRADLSQAVAEAGADLTPGAGRTVVVAADTDSWRVEIDEGLARSGAKVVRPDAGAWRREAERADLGITSAVLAVASTGSILIVPGPDHPRVASLLPAAHLAVVPADRLVAGFEDVTPALEDAVTRSSGPVLITGPSRTSDIEMTMVFGVHGSKSLTVLVVEEG